MGRIVSGTDASMMVSSVVNVAAWVVGIRAFLQAGSKSVARRARGVLAARRSTSRRGSFVQGAVRAISRRFFDSGSPRISTATIADESPACKTCTAPTKKLHSATFREQDRASRYMLSLHGVTRAAAPTLLTLCGR